MQVLYSTKAKVDLLPESTRYLLEYKYLCTRVQVPAFTPISIKFDEPAQEYSSNTFATFTSSSTVDTMGVLFVKSTRYLVH